MTTSRRLKFTCICAIKSLHLRLVDFIFIALALALTLGLLQEELNVTRTLNFWLISRAGCTIGTPKYAPVYNLKPRDSKKKWHQTYVLAHRNNFFCHRLSLLNTVTMEVKNSFLSKVPISVLHSLALLMAS